MPNNSPTIVAASLSDQILKDSIKKLVDEVNGSVNKMAENFNTAIGSMEAKLKSLGNVKIDFGVTSSGGGTKKAIDDQKSLEEQTKKTVQSFDNQSNAIKTATTNSSGLVSSLESVLNKINEINSSKSGKSMFEKVSSMPSDNIDQAKAKLEALNALKEKVYNTPFLSKQNFNSLIQQIDNTSKKIESLGFKASGINQSTDSIKMLNEYVKYNIALEKKRQDETILTGLRAMDASEKIVKSMHEQSQSTDGAISGSKELRSEIEKMKRAYYALSESDRQSAIGKLLQDDIDRAEKAILVVQKYNASLLYGKKTDVGILTNEDSLNSVRNKLKLLSEQYRKLTAEEINAGKGDQLVEHFQRISRAAEVLQKNLSRPVSLDSITKYIPKTLDDMVYKLRMLESYKSGINVTTPEGLRELKETDLAIQRLKKDYDGLLMKNKQLLESNNALGRSWNYMKNRLAFYFTVGASTQFIKNLIEVRSQYEMNERALGILINSAERGTQIFNELSQMALVSPYTLIELSNAAKQLTAYDIAAKDVVDTTRRLADMASAVGVPMERLTYALGQIKAYGYLNSRDARMFANAGIPLVRELSKYYSELEGKVVSVGDVYDRMKKKTIDYNDVMSVVTKMTDEGGKFFDFQAKMADTLKVRLANLTLAWNNMLNEIGASEQGVLTTGIGMLKDFFLHWKDIEEIIKKVVYAFGLFKAAQMIALAFMGELNTAIGMQVLLGSKLQSKLASLASGTKALSVGLSAFGMAFWAILADAYVTYSRNAEEIERLNRTIADGAKEASEALDKMLHSSEMVSSRLSASQGKLSAADAAKTWEVLREQMEMSALSSKTVIAEIIEDINKNGFDKGIGTAFGFAESIQNVTSKLGDLNDKLQITQDSMLGGAFGEGIVEDIDDYNERLKYEAELAEWAADKNRGFWENAVIGLKVLFNSVKEDLGSSSDEAKNEIRKFAQDAAQVIKDELGEEALKDKIQVNEAIARVLQGFEKMYPQIRGKGKVLFETMFNDIMATEFKGSVDRQAYYYDKFLEQLKKDHGSAFGDVTDEVLKDTHKWSSAQLDAINKTADKLKKDLPDAYQDAINKILDNLNKTEFKVRIVAEMATTSLGEVEKQFNEKFIKKPWIEDQKEREKAEAEAAQKYSTLRRKTTESNVEYEKRISDERKKQLELSQKNADIISANKNNQDEYSKAVVKDAEKAKESADAWLKAANEVEKAGGYDFSTKSERSAASKAQKAAETELQKALKEELKLIDEVRSQYKKLTDAGVSRAVAMKTVTEQFGDSIAHINAVLGKNGLPKFDIKTFAGTDNPHEMMVMLKKQIDAAKRVKNIKPEEISELEIKYSKIKVDAEAYDATKIKKGLDNELGRLKDEYELAVELDANPELGNMFADMFDIDLDTLPRTAKEYADRYTKSLNKYFKEMGASIELPNMLNLTRDDMAAFQEQFDSNQLQQVYFDLIQKGYEATQEARKKESTDAIKEYDKLLQKYAEYQYKLTRIAKEANNERKALVVKFGTDEQKESARKIYAQLEIEDDPKKAEELREQLKALVDQVVADDALRIQLKVAIDKKEAEESAKTAFEEFQKSPEWVIATGDLAGLTDRALGGLIKRLEEYKKKSKNLDPKQIKQINNALKNLYKQQREGNPFASIANMLDQAKQRMEDIQPELDSIMSDIIALEKEIGDNDPTEEQAKHLEELKERWKELYEQGNVSANEWVNTISQTVNVVKGAVGVFDDLAKAIGGIDRSDVDKVFSIIDKAVSGAQIGASFGTYGAIIGAVAGAASGIISEYADEWIGNASITKEIERSEISVKKLEATYKKLQYEVDKAYGTATIGARQAAVANRKLQLEEMKRQLQLEKSRDSKNRDANRIEELRQQIIDLEHDIADATDDIVNNLLGISSIGDSAESLMSSFISALRNGEDAMSAFNDGIDEMIANMVMKLYTTKVIEPWFNEQWDKIQASIQERSQGDADKYAAALKELEERTDAVEWGSRNVTNNIVLAKVLSDYFRISMFEFSKRQQYYIDRFIEEAKNNVEESKKSLDSAQQITVDDIRRYAELLRSGSPIMDENLKAIQELLKELGIINSDLDSSKLSALQQGIQGITEDTAGALEAMMNGMSQQIYLHTDLLIQIRDAVYNITGGDLETGIQAQMLFQLQQSYTVQMAIQNILEGAVSPNGQSFRVELVS